ncbi:MAG: hypothetical protein N2578_00210, partial [Bdellovibrionaceae bacterium]|nr:hypothetical protein [Pseudobdellovibrionaceae bacterium]
MYSEFSETSTSCSKMRSAIVTARIGSRGLSAVHISGPAGTGKTSLAKFMHISGRPHARILTVDSKQLTAQTVQRILPEKLPATLLIENVDGLSQEGIEVVRTLLTNRIAIDLKVITTSRQDLRSLTRRGFFPDDLFYKLTSIFIELPEITKRGLDFE